MHPAISQFPSAFFYANRLLDDKCVEGVAYKQPYHDIKGLGPYCFLDVHQGRELHVFSSLSNKEEADIAVGLFYLLCRTCPTIAFGGRVGIVTPYKSQMTTITRTFQRVFGETILKSVEIATVDSFQGREKDIVIFSCVRAHPSKGIGFLSDVRRMNVGLTRAKYSLFILGNTTALQQNDTWRALVEDARRRKVVHVVSNTDYPLPRGYSSSDLQYALPNAYSQSTVSMSNLYTPLSIPPPPNHPPEQQPPCPPNNDNESPEEGEIGEEIEDKAIHNDMNAKDGKRQRMGEGKMPKKKKKIERNKEAGYPPENDVIEPPLLRKSDENITENMTATITTKRKASVNPEKSAMDFNNNDLTGLRPDRIGGKEGSGGSGVDINSSKGLIRVPTHTRGEQLNRAHRQKRPIKTLNSQGQSQIGQPSSAPLPTVSFSSLHGIPNMNPKSTKVPKTTVGNKQFAAMKLPSSTKLSSQPSLLNFEKSTSKPNITGSITGGPPKLNPSLNKFSKAPQ
eukprot:Ihof_evm1s3 gene=Ihof_evmTU1s3